MWMKWIGYGWFVYEKRFEKKHDIELATAQNS